MLNGTVGCGCMEQNTEYFVTSFITFSNDAFSALTTTPEAPFPAIATDAGPSIGPTACLDGKGPRVALSWDMQTRTRAPFSGASTFVYDFTGSTPTIDAGDLPTKTMALMVDRGDRDCTSLLNVLLTQNMLLVANAMVANDQDGIYTDPNPHDPNDGPISITSQSPLIPPGFAVTLDFGGASDLAISATSAFLYQHDPDGRFTIWFRDALTTDTITVTPK
jgi:hypothetical protein